MSYLGQMVMKIVLTMQSVHIAKTISQPVRPKVAAFTGKVECKKYPKAVCNSMTNEQQMKVQSCMNNKASNLPQSRLVQMLGLLLLRQSILSLRKVMSRKWRERLLKNQHEGETEGILQQLARHWVQSARNLADS